MEITWNTSFKEIAKELGLEDKPWLVDAYWEAGPAEQLDGREIGDAPMEELAEKQLMQPRDSIVNGFRFLAEEMQKGSCLYDIWDEAERKADPGKEQTGLFAFPVEGAERFLLLIPGGGYFNVCSFVEGFPFAQRCRELGIASFILKYRCSNAAHYPNPQEDAAQAVRFIQEHAKDFGLTGTKYAVCGFSAGGHLAASFGVENLGWGKFGVPKPEAELLGYPVVTMADLTHDGSRQFLLVEDAASEEVRNRYSVEKQITPDYPPIFVWNCADDCVVPHENSDMLEAAAKGNGVPVRREVYPGIVHGWGLADGTPAEGWFDRALAFWGEHQS